MKIKYTFINGEIKEVEVSEEIGSVIEESRRKEASLAKKEQRHCYSLDAVTYEGMEYGEPDFAESLFDGSDERSAHIREAFSHLTETQQRRILMLAAGKTVREIAIRENTHHSSIGESIKLGRKKFLKYYKPELFMHIGNCICKWLCMIKQLQS